MSNKKPFKLEIYTPERIFFKGEVESLIINTESGEIGIMYQTLPIVTLLTDGIIKIEQNAKWMEAVTGTGFINVSRSVVTILTESALWPHEVNTKEVKEEIDHLDEATRRARSYQEYKIAKAQLAAQFAKLKLKDRNI